MTVSIDRGNPRDVWLERFLSVYRESNREIYQLLVEASEDAEKRLIELYGKDNIGAKIERAQINGTRNVIAEVLKELFRGRILPALKSGRQNAAVASVRAANVWDDQILRLVTDSPSQRKILKKSLEETARKGIEVVVSREINGSLRLSRQVYKTEALARGQVNRAVNSGIARGNSAATIAKEVRSMIEPNVRGGVAYAANRLTRTEINNAYHAQSISTMKDRPWISQVEWRLSKSHKSTGCQCEMYAGIGTFSAFGIPMKPHPQCFCYTTPVVPSTEFILQQFDSGIYDQWLEEHEVSRAA